MGAKLHVQTNLNHIALIIYSIKDPMKILSLVHCLNHWTCTFNYTSQRFMFTSDKYHMFTVRSSENTECFTTSLPHFLIHQFVVQVTMCHREIRRWHFDRGSWQRLLGLWGPYLQRPVPSWAPQMPWTSGLSVGFDRMKCWTFNGIFF